MSKNRMRTAELKTNIKSQKENLNNKSNSKK